MTGMPFFFFHLDGSLPPMIEDDKGEELPSDEAAEQRAREIAWELARNASQSDREGRSVLLRDDHGRELLRVSLEGAIPPRGADH